MNIFVLDRDVKKCAIYHNDKHVVKMILESAQLLCGVHHMTESNINDIPYKLSHKNHPCSIWAREDISNYLWLCELGLELCKEYTYRYGRRHKATVDKNIKFFILISFKKFMDINPNLLNIVKNNHLSKNYFNLF